MSMNSNENNSRDYTEGTNVVRGIVQGLFWSTVCFWAPLTVIYLIAYR